jgi:hypothetical protein
MRIPILGLVESLAYGRYVGPLLNLYAAKIR